MVRNKKTSNTFFLEYSILQSFISTKFFLEGKENYNN